MSSSDEDTFIDANNVAYDGMVINAQPFSIMTPT